VYHDVLTKFVRVTATLGCNSIYRFILEEQAADTSLAEQAAAVEATLAAAEVIQVGLMLTLA